MGMVGTMKSIIVMWRTATRSQASSPFNLVHASRKPPKPQIQGKAVRRGRCKQGDPPAKRLRSSQAPKMGRQSLSFKVCSSLWGKQVRWQFRPGLEVARTAFLPPFVYK